MWILVEAPPRGPGTQGELGMDLLCTPLDVRFDTREAPTGGGRAAGIAAKAGFVADFGAAFD